MEVFRITLLSLLLCMAYVPYAAAAEPPIYAVVGKEITLPCPSGGTDPNKIRSWYRGSYDLNNPPPEKKLIYAAGGGDKPVPGPQHRGDMKFDDSSFAMTLTVQNSPIDNDHFTCLTKGTKDKYDVQEVLIFLQPVIDIDTDVQPEEGVNVTVICTVERLYPNITSDQFTMTWGKWAAKETQFSGVRNDDESMKYTLEKSKNLTREDEGMEITCTVTPDANFGDRVMNSMVLNYTMGPTRPPGSGGSNYGATIGKVISGLAAFIIAVVVSDCGIV